LARNLATPYLDRKPKAKIVTNYLGLSKRRASLGELNPDHEGLAHATRKVCTLHTLKKISVNKNF
jgi:hypothetical protein